MEHKSKKYNEAAAIQAAQERTAEPDLRDILKREHDHPRPENPALEKWSSVMEQEIMAGKVPKLWEAIAKVNDELVKRAASPKKEEPEIEME